MLCARRCLRPYPGEATELRAFDTGRNRLAPPPATLPARAYFGCQPLRVPASAYSVAATDCLGLNMLPLRGAPAGTVGEIVRPSG